MVLGVIRHALLRDEVAIFESLPGAVVNSPHKEVL